LVKESLREHALPTMNKHIDTVGRGFADFMIPPPEDVIRFTVGQPDFDTPASIRSVAIKELKNGNTFYTRSAGSVELCKGVSSFLLDKHGISIDWEGVVVTPGCKQALLYALMGLGNPGDEVLLLAPAWPTYDAQVRLVGMIPVHVPVKRENYHPDFDALENAINENTKFIFVNSPNNPTGAVYTPEEIQQLVDLAHKHDLWIIDDMIYATMVWDESEYVSPSNLEGGKERTITIGGWSKAWSMTGWRLGWAAGPPEAMRAIQLCQTSAATHVPTFTMNAALTALGSEKERIEMNEEFARRREVVYQGLKDIPQFYVPKPEGAFYILIDVSGTGMDDITFATRALNEAKVQLIPGSLMEGGNGLCRISYATSIENIKEGCRRLKKWLMYNQ